MPRWSGRWGACCPRGNPLSPGLRRRVEVWERWVAQLGKGGRTLPAHLACLRGAQSGWGRSDRCPSAPGLVCGWEGTPGYAGARCKSRRVKRGDATCGPRTRPVARDPRLDISGGGGQKGGVEVCAPSHLGQGSKGETAYLSRVALAPRLCAKAGWRESHVRRMGKRLPTYRAGGIPGIPQPALPLLLCAIVCTETVARQGRYTPPFSPPAHHPAIRSVPVYARTPHMANGERAGVTTGQTGGGCVRTLFLHPLLVAPPRLLARG